MPNENDMTYAGMLATVDDIEETRFLKSTRWILDAHVQDSDALMSALRQEAARFKELCRRPRFSLLAVLHNTRPRHLRELILSVRCQSYQDWELVLVDDGSTARKHLDIARSWAHRDARVRVRSIDSPTGPSRAKNLAFEESTGDYLIIVDGDGVLHPMALGVFARHINENPSVNFMFANEAEIDYQSDGLTNFLVKPPLDRFTLLRIPYIGRLYAASRDLLERAAQRGPVFRHEYDGIEEHDLWLRIALTEGLESRHSSLFTYYRRAGSAGAARFTDQELVERRQRLAEEFVPQIYPGATWSLNVPDDRDPLASTSIWLKSLSGWTCPKLLIVIPFKDEVETTIQCLESIERQEHRLDVLVALVNNNSAKESTLPQLRSWIASPRTSAYQILDHDGAFNFAKINNRAVACLGLDRDLVLLLNNDVELSMPRTLQTMAVQVLADPMVGFLGIKLYYPDGTEIQHGGIRFSEFICGSGYHGVKHGDSAAEFVDSERITLGVTFACAMTRRETFQKLGGLEELYVPNAFGDVSMCLLALESGFRNYYLGSLSGIHHESKSRAYADEDHEFSFVYERHGMAIASWRRWHLNRSRRYAWPLLVRPLNDPPTSEQNLGHTAPTEPQAPQTDGRATIRLPLRHRPADQLTEAMKRILGPLYRILSMGDPRLPHVVRVFPRRGDVVVLGRRALGPMPVVGTLARKSLRQARKIRHRWRVSAGLFKVLRRNPDAASLLAIGLRQGGVRGLRQSIRMLVPIVSPAPPPSTQDWFDATRPSRRLLARLRRHRWPAHAPKFTVVTPVYNVKEEWLREAVESVIAQTYPHWEMICVNDSSTAAHIRPTLDELSARDPRVRVIHCERNHGVSAATNLGLNQATGDYIAFMDHDDYLEPHALHWFAEAVLQDRPDMIYSDEAITDVDINCIQDVWCRPSFSYDYYVSCPFFVHLVVARTEIVRRVGGLNEAMTISQDVDFVLRLIEECRNIAHVPEVLYRWRTHPASLGHQQKDNVNAMTCGALERHFERLGLAVEFDDRSRFNFRDLRFPVTPAARVAIVISTKDEAGQLGACVASLESTVAPGLAEIMILDQSRSGRAATSLPEDMAADYRVLRCEEVTTSTLLNRGATASKTATHFLFLHDDIQAIDPSWLAHMLGYAERADVGIVGATLLYPDETIQHAGTAIGVNGTHDHLLKHAHFRDSDSKRWIGNNGIMLASRDVSAVTGACLLVRADVFERLGGFDESLTCGYYDLDLCLRARALGYKVIQDAYAVLYHAELECRGGLPQSAHWSDLRRFLARHGALVFGGDPFYSPLMSTSSADMALAHRRRAPERVRSRTMPVVLPRRDTGPKSLRVDSASPFRPITQYARFAAEVDDRKERFKR